MTAYHAPAAAIAAPVAPASEKQIALVSKLAREIHGNAGGSYLVSIADVLKDRKATSELIDGLIAAAKAKRGDAARKADVELPEPGYYATEYLGVLRFYAVRAGKGKWEGRRFLNRFRSDLEDRVFRAEQVAFCEAVEGEGLEAARQRFAAELVCCYRCARKLTDAESRRLGIGPDCRARA